MNISEIIRRSAPALGRSSLAKSVIFERSESKTAVLALRRAGVRAPTHIFD
jgi:hypothetical protein